MAGQAGTDMNNSLVQSVLADYTSRANDTFTWYENGKLVNRYANGTAKLHRGLEPGKE